MKIEFGVIVIKSGPCKGMRTLGGDIAAMTQEIRMRCLVTKRQARALLSSACERIELAADGELDHVKPRDVFAVAKQIAKQKGLV